MDEDVSGLPQVLALAGTLAAIVSDEVGLGHSFQRDVIDVAGRAGLLDRWPLSVQRTRPWMRVAKLAELREPGPDRTAAAIMTRVLEVTCD